VNNSILQLKIKQRLNKLASNDYDNIECWQVVEAFNKAQSDWCRRQLHGSNVTREGDEQSTVRIDDLQNLLVPAPLVTVNKQVWVQAPRPADYMHWKAITAYATNECCTEKRRLMIWQVEEGNINEILRDYNKRPSFEWAETVSTQQGNDILIYTNGEFDVVDASLVYYRQPTKIQILNCVNPYTGVTSTSDVICEFKDDIVEVMIDEAVAILAGDIESMNQRQIEEQRVEKNN
jgi:hypothetical protein